MSIIIDILDLCRIRIFIILLNFGRNISRVNQEVASLSLCVECLRRDIIQRHSLIECHTSCIQPHSQRILSINIALQDGLTLSLQRSETIFLVSDHLVVILQSSDLYMADSRSAISRSFLRSELEDYVLVVTLNAFLQDTGSSVSCNSRFLIIAINNLILIILTH